MIRKILRVLSVTVLATVLVIAPSLSANPQDSRAAPQRPFHVDDLFELESVGRYWGGPYAFSTDGKRLAYTRVRASKTLANYKWQFLWGNAGGDVWVRLSPGQESFNITNGLKDGSGWWSPQWSPDGQKLAMLSTHGGNVRLWLWDGKSGELRPLSSRAVDLVDLSERPYLWADSEHIVCPVLPGDEQPEEMKIELQTQALASAAWPKVPQGKEVTSNVLESGVAVDLGKREQGDLLLIDVSAGAERVIAHGSTRSQQLSPDGKAVAYTREVSRYAPNSTEPLRASSGGRSVIEVVTLEGQPVGASGELSRDVLPQSLRWSPSGKELAFFGYAAGRDQAPMLYRLDVARKTVVGRRLEALDVDPIDRFASPAMEWMGNGDVIVRAAKRVGEAKPDVRARRDWWLVKKDGPEVCLTGAMKTPVGDLWAQDGRSAFVGLAEGRLWRLEPASGKAEDLTAQFAKKVDHISWPMSNADRQELRGRGQSYAQLFFATVGSEDFTGDLYLLDFRSGTIRPIKKPSSKGDLVAYAPATGTGVFYASDRNGLQIWETDIREGKSAVLVRANEFLHDVAEAAIKPVGYKSLNGETLKAWLLLPIGYEPGKRYPLLTEVYPGSVARAHPPSSVTINSNFCLNLEIAAAHGYAVLLPSMPLAPDGTADDAMLRLPDGVLPAVDKAIEMGVADPERLFLIGQSFGGFATYGLVTGTKRFTAAVSLAGFSDLISLYGQFDARDRYAENPQENLFMEFLMESGQIRMWNPPWKDLGRYLRNSPIFYVDRVETPLLIIQGDIDYVAMQQGEEFFTSLYRQGKRARFVRYWGEGHVLESPANIRDMWKQIFSWFDEFSAQKVKAKGDSN